MKSFEKLIGVLVVMCFFSCALTCSSRASGDVAMIILDNERVVGHFGSGLLGSNLEWTDNGDTLFTSSGAVKSQALDAVKELPTAGIRFPGGLLSSTYYWQDGISDQLSRGNGTDFSGNSQKMVVGTDEYLDLLAETGRPGMITVNVTRSADEAGAWVDYVHTTAPGAVPLWEVGNESFMNQDPSFMSAAEYVKRFKQFVTTMKKEDSSIKVGAILEASLVGVTWAKVVVPEAEIWNKSVVNGTAGVADYYTVHLYAPFDAHKDDDLATLRVLQTSPLAMADNLRKVKRLINKYAPGAFVLVTEFNIGMSDSLAAWKYDISLAQAAYVAQMLALFSTNGVEGAYHWSLIGNHCFGQIISGDDPRPRPSAMLYKLLGSLVGAQAVYTEVDTDLLPYKEIGNVVTGLSPTIIFAQGYRRGCCLKALVVNRKPNSSVDVTFCEPDGTALTLTRGMMLTGDGPLAQIDKTPDDVGVTEIILPPGGLRVMETSAAQEVRPSLSKVTLPPCSVALVELR